MTGFYGGRCPKVKKFEEANLNSIFEAVADATEEAIVNSMLSSAEMTGRDGNRVHALPFNSSH